MLAHQRQDFILRKVVTNGGVRVSHVVAELGVSDMTIRRDIDALVAKGLVTKVHGGAIPTRQGVPTHTVSGSAPGSYSVLGRAAASLVDAGTSVSLSAGAAAYAVASELRNTAGLSVVTNAPVVEEVLHDPTRDDRVVVLTGGARTASGGLAGPVAIDMLARTHVDTAIIGSRGHRSGRRYHHVEFAGGPGRKGHDQRGPPGRGRGRPGRLGDNAAVNRKRPEPCGDTRHRRSAGRGCST